MIVNELLVALVRPADVASRDFVPLVLLLRSLKVATPEVVDRERVPFSVPVPERRAIEMDVPVVVRSLSKASWSFTVTAGEIVCPAVVVLGCWTKVSFEADPALTTMLPDVMEVRLPLENRTDIVVATL